MNLDRWINLSSPTLKYAQYHCQSIKVCTKREVLKLRFRRVLT